MMYKYYSLCISTYNEAINQISTTWRVADFDLEGNYFTEALFNYREREGIELEDYKPLRIFGKRDSFSYLIPEVRCWQVEEGEHSPRILSESEKGLIPLELIFVPEIDPVTEKNDDEIRKQLYSGITIPDYTAEQFLLVVHTYLESYIALVLKMEDFTFSNNKLYLKKTAENLNQNKDTLKVFVGKNDIFNTDSVFEKTSERAKFSNRKFFKYTDFVAEEEEIFQYRELRDYAPAFMNYYLKSKKNVLELTKKESQKLIEIVCNGLSQQDEIEKFFETSEYACGDLEDIFSDLQMDIRTLYLESDLLEKIIENCIFRDPEVEAKCVLEGKKLWMAEHNDEILLAKQEMEKLVKDKKAITHEIHCLNNDAEKIKQKNDNLISKKEKLEQDIGILEENNNKITQRTQETLHTFQNDLVQLATISSFSSFSSSNTEHSDPFYYAEGTVLNNTEAMEEIEDLSDFSEELEENLLNYGLDPEFSFHYTEFILTSIACHKQFIVCGGYAVEIANALSLLVQGTTTDQIFLENQATSISSVVTKIQDTPSQVVVVHNGLSTYSEALFLPLVTQCPNKVIFFSCEDDDVYSSFPHHWGKYVSFLFPDLLWGEASAEQLHTSSVVLSMLFSSKECAETKGRKSKFAQLHGCLTEKNLKILNVLFLKRKQLFNGDTISFPFVQMIEFLLAEQTEDFTDFLETTQMTVSEKRLFQRVTHEE